MKLKEELDKLKIPYYLCMWFSNDQLLAAKDVEFLCDFDCIKTNIEMLEFKIEIDSIIENFNELYGPIEDLNDFQKTMMVLNYIHFQIAFAYEFTKREGDTQSLILPEDKYCCHAVGTLKKKKGLCFGITDLAWCLLKHPKMNVNCQKIIGKVHEFDHAWLVINNNQKVYGCCLTMKNYFQNLNEFCYYSPQNIEYATLSKEQVKELQNSLTEKARYNIEHKESKRIHKVL